MDETLITLDIDWAPDFAIDFTAGLLAEHAVRATWLVTHTSPAVERLGERSDLFELGIHPNFRAGSSHGATPREVLAHCLGLVPDATTVRAHSLVQSTQLLQLFLTESQLVAELSTFLPNASHLEPVPYTFGGRTLYRLPFMWEDDYLFGQQSANWSPAQLGSDPGMRIFNFHPIHVYLNSCSDDPYSALKSQTQPLVHMTEDIAAPFVNGGAGTRTFFAELVAILTQQGGGTCIRDLVARAHGSV